MTVIQQARRIADDHDSGASELLQRLLPLLDEAVSAGRKTTIDVARIVCRGQPTMAPLWHAAAAALAEFDRPGTFAQARMEMMRAPDALVRAAAYALGDALAGERAPLILTLSYSASVVRTLREAAQTTPLHVVCGEGRPRFEGRRFASEVAGPTIRATLVVDGALSGFLGSAAAVLLGADAVGANRWINKAGSLGLAAAAGSVGKPVFVIATRDKFVPPAMEPLLRLPAAPPDEVWGNAPDNVEVANRYFEFIPADLVTFFLTEAGPIPPTDLGPAVSRGNDDISFLINILQ